MSVADLRQVMVDAAKGALPERVAFYPTSVDGLSIFPAVVLGMPSWRPVTGCVSQWDFPVAVIVDRPGVSDAATAETLDELWPEVLDAFLGLRDTGQITDVLRAEFGMFNVQGQDYPAQVITCTLTTTS